MDDIEESVRSRVRERRLNLASFFQDFDKCRLGHVSKHQLHRVMATLSFELDEPSVTLLCRRYCDLGNHIEFNYQSFCQVCNPLSDKERTAMEQNMQPYEPPTSNKYFDSRGRVIPCNA